MVEQLKLGEITIDVVLKDIKNIHLSIYPPSGRVKISAPLKMKLDTIRVYAISRMNWIRQQQKKFQEQKRETPREYLDRESHYVWGKRYLLKVEEIDEPPTVELKHRWIILRVRPGSTEVKHQEILEDWYRQQLREAIPSLAQKWEKTIKVHPSEWRIKKMKTHWGTCSIKRRRIWLNLELAKKPKRCLEYIMMHELTHLLEKKHNDRFRMYMDQFMSNWRVYKDELNRLPISHVEWNY